MKCENCPALRSEGYEYPEEYCAAYVPDGGKMRTEDGCRYSLAKINRRMQRADSLRDRQYDGIGEWYEEQQGLESAMSGAISEAQSDYSGGVLYLCFSSPVDGHYYPLCGDGKPTSDLAYDILRRYEEAESDVQRPFCRKCRWRSRPQKCACCRRNRHMKDNYEEET